MEKLKNHKGIVRVQMASLRSYKPAGDTFSVSNFHKMPEDCLLSTLTNKGKIRRHKKAQHPIIDHFKNSDATPVINQRLVHTKCDSDCNCIRAAQP